MSKNRIVRTEKAPTYKFLSQAVVSNGMVYCAGTVGIDPRTGKMVQGTIQDRARQGLANLQAILEEAGSSLQNVVKCNIYLDSLQHFDKMNDVYLAFFGEHRPARTCVADKELFMGTDFEIECIASL